MPGNWPETGLEAVWRAQGMLGCPELGLPPEPLGRPVPQCGVGDQWLAQLAGPGTGSNLGQCAGFHAHRSGDHHIPHSGARVRHIFMPALPAGMDGHLTRTGGGGVTS